MMLDRIIILIRIRKMIVLPWFVRFGLDCTVAMTPIFYFHHHPTLFIFEYFQNRRRIVRRKTIDNFAYLNDQPTVSREETAELFKELGIEQ